MKRTFRKAMSVFLVVAMLLCAAPLNGFVGLELPSLFDFRAEAAKYSGTCGENLVWSLDTSIGVLNITGTGAMTNWSSDSDVPWYSYCDSIKTVSIADDITSIGNYAVYGCSNLTSITIPDSVTSIGYGAFEDCGYFNEVYYGGTEEEWNKITIGTNNETLTSATIHFAEPEMSIIASGTYGDNLTWTLYETGLLEVSGTGPMYNGLDSEDYPWWIHGSSIKSVVIGDGITTLSEYAFHWWYPNLADVIIPDSVTIIGDFAFYDCESLTNITIPDSVTTICINAFYCCKNLSTITIGKSVIGIGKDAFTGCSNLTDVYYNSTKENWKKISIDSGNDSLISATIHFSDGEIESGVADYTLLNDAKESFENLFSDDYTADSWADAEKAYLDACAVSDDLTVNEQYIIDELAVALTDAIDSLVANPLNKYEVSGKCGPRAEWRFNQLTGVLKITGSGVITSWSNPDSVPWYEYAYDIRAVRISRNITRISDYAFYDCENLTSISIPDKVKAIGAYAFSGCKRLMKVQLGDSIESIGEFAFENCSLIRRITFPNSLKSLSDDVFIYCSSLVSISIPAGVTSLGYFYDINEGDIDIYFGGTKDEWDELCWDDLPDNITVKFVNYQPGDVFADYSKVEAALECVPEDLTVYSDESLSRLYHALNSVVCYLEIFYQNEVDKFAAEIEDAVAKLEYNRLCDYTRLNEALDKYHELAVFSDYYTAETWAAVQHAFEVARTIPEDLFVDVKGENQQMIDEATLALLEAINNLIREEKADKTALLAAIYSVYDYNADEYTADSWQRVAAALAYAECVNADKSASQQMIDVATAELEVALHSLVKNINIDKTELLAVINSAYDYNADEYTADSWQRLAVALANAECVNADESASQQMIDVATAELEVALHSLVKKVDKTALVSAIDLAKSYENDGYTDDSWAAFVQALENAKTVLDDDNAIQETVDLAETTLLTAMQNLKLKDDDINSDPCKDGHNWSASGNLCVVCGITGGVCGSGLNWSLDNSGHLEITGTGWTMEWSDILPPWYSYRKRIKTATICNGVLSIREDAFRDCENLTSIAIPDSLIVIGVGAFSYCESLENVTIPDSVTQIEWDAFYRCRSLKSITIPDSVTTIGGWAFEYCDSLTSVTIGDGVTTIGDSAFRYCDSLISITVDKNNAYYSNDEYGALFNKDKTELIQYPVGSTKTSCTIADSVKKIGDSAFQGCESLTNITIPDSVTTIGDFAFYECENLTNVTIPDSITTIGDYIFSCCFSLTSVTIPDSVITIGDFVFNGCYSLTNVTIPNSVISIGDSAFECCDSLTSVTIPDSVISIGRYAFGDCYSLTDVYYKGTKEDWNKITIGSDNEQLTSATIHYSYGKPSITPVDGAVVDDESGTIYGLDAGADSLDRFMELADGYEWSYDEGQYGFGTGTVATIKNGDTVVAEYTVLIFGDIDGNGWYDANDAFIVNMIASGIISADRLNSAQQKAADCNHDGKVDSADFYLLNQASVMLDNVDQSASQAELSQNAMYISYCSLIDQTAGEENNLVPAPETAPDTVPETAPETSEDETGFDFEAFFRSILDFFKNIFAFIFGNVDMPVLFWAK